MRIDHVNLVVENLDRMLAFYTASLGLVVSRQATIHGDWVDRVTGVAGVEADVVYLEPPGGGARVELIRYRRPVGERPSGIGVANAPGLRHLAFQVEDIVRALDRVRAAGGSPLSEVQVVPGTQVSYAGGARKRLVYFRDPEGNLLELASYS